MLSTTLQFFLPPPSNRSFCCYSGRQDPMVEMSNYKEVFSRRMTMAGLKPHHKIALGVSGGVDSIALCILTAGWKTDALIGKDAKNGYINGLLAIVVDHGLREESKTESNLAQNIVSEMGVRSEIASCNWPSGMPKQGHVQEAARDMRYRLLQKVCMENQIDVLLVAHHADDQAELFILRLSRNSSVLGLAGMAFTSQLFPIHVHYHSEDSSNHGILLVRPLLEFTKADLYNICQSGNKTWVEDPTNKKTMYARNRIRKKLNSLSSSMKQQHLKKENTPMSDTCEILICDKRARDNRHVSDDCQTHVVSDAHLTMDTSSPLTDKALDGVELSFNKCLTWCKPIDESPQRWLGIFKSEIQAIILACRKSRSYVDKTCCDLIKRTVTVTPHGCAIIDLEKLDPANVEDICLSKFIALVLQFISQRHRPVRGRTSKLVLDYIRNVPCKNSLTAAACYLCAAPQSKGTKILVCCSPDSPQPSTMELSHKYYYGEKKCCKTSEIEQILMDGKTYSDCLVPDVSNLAFLHATSPVSILNEAKRLNILSDSTLTSILLLQKEENESFNDKSKVQAKNETRHGIRSSNISLSESLRSGQCSHFMNRFFVMWRFLETTDDTLPFEEFNSNWSSDRANEDDLCKSCVIGRDAIVRPMLDSDWLYLARLSKGQTSDLCQEYKILSASKDQRLDKRISCADYVRLSAQRALRTLKSIPVAARRGLPVLMNSQGLLLSIPNVYFKHCPLLSVSAVFKPKVPLGGGHSSFL